MKKTIFLLMLLNVTLFSWAQRTPEHPLDIPEGSTDLFTILETWNPGTPPPGTNAFDDQFYISRVRPLSRIVDGDYQVKPTLDRNRKLAMWVPLDDPSVKWKALPRYSFEGDNFGMWSYVDIHGNWTAPWLRVSAGLTDVAHKNGVKVGAVYSIPWAASVSATQTNAYGKVFYRMFEKNGDGTYKYAQKLVKLMKYYGIDGLGCNSEFYSNTAFMNSLIDFVKVCKTEAKNIDWEFQLHWYDGTNDAGSITFDKGLAAHNDGVFGNGTAPVTDMMFFNYNWTGSILASSVSFAENMGRSSYDLYAGFDIQGRAFKNGNWQALADNKISIGLWGAHAQSLLHQSATDDGTSDIAIQKAYLMKQELAFSGGNRNPALTPAIRTDASLANADLKTFHGLGALLTAKSTIQQVPFVTRFSLGNGLFFNNNGVTTFNHKWHNINTQDFLPTWRWWITDAADQVTQADLTGLIKADFTFDDAWFGGSCLKLHGQTSFSRVKLFKTKLTVQPNYTLSLTYKVINGTNPKAKIFVAKQGQLTDYKEVALPHAAEAGKWTTFTINVSELGVAANDVISMLGVSLENTDSNFELLLGEMALRNPAQSFNTASPTITKVDILRGRYNQVDFKLFYQSKEESNGVKTYNDEVGTWYYEIYFQQKNQQQQLITATTSWAGYVIDAPLNPNGEREGRFGVRAVDPSGINGSFIVWSDYQSIPYNNPVETVKADKPVIKPNESFTISYDDVLHAPATKWEIVNPLDNAVLATATNSLQITTSIAQVGMYDLIITDNTNKKTTIRGYVQITPEETGAVPRILSLEANKQEQEVNKPVTYTYTSRDGEGSVSRGLRINDPNMFRVPGASQTTMDYSYAVWFKIDKFSHDKQGTNLINKNTIADSWPHNNWGDLWVTIRPQWTGNTTHPANEISFNTYGWTAHDSPNESMMSTNFSVTPGVWNHLVVTHNASKQQKMYFNGKKVAETIYSASSRRGSSSDIYFGGGNVYKAGLNGWIDEVQVWSKALSDAEVLQAMKGYQTAPDGLVAYYTFEEKTGNSSFANKGTGGVAMQGDMVVMDGSGGESTGTASYKLVEADNNALGFAGITGSLPINTSAKWNLDGASIPTGATGKQIEVSYANTGTFNAGLELSNPWAKDVKTLVDYMVIKSYSGVKQNELTEISIYPNPFVESVNLKFEEAGSYTARLLTLNGQVILNQNVQINDAGEAVNIKLNADKGNYLLQIVKDGKIYSAMKLIKK